jgi:hypothetical protein
MFTAAWARRHARERLGIEADEMDGGHYVALSRPGSWPNASTHTPRGFHNRGRRRSSRRTGTTAGQPLAA